MTSSQLLIKCANRGARQAKAVVAMVKDALKRDDECRANGTAVSFTECVRLNKISSLAQNRLTLKLKRFRLDKCTAGDDEDDDVDAENDDEDDESAAETERRNVAGGSSDREDTEMVEGVSDEMNLVTIGKKSSALESKDLKWIPDDDDEEISDDADVQPVEPAVRKVVRDKKRRSKSSVKMETTDSEEEDTIVLASAD